MDTDRLIGQFVSARSDPSMVVLEGMHALKHAVRFGAQIDLMITSDPVTVEALLVELAPDLAETLLQNAQTVSAAVFKQCFPQPHHTKIGAIAFRPSYSLASIPDEQRPVALLEEPRAYGNLGAAIRVAAGANASALLTIGGVNIWDSAVVRGSAGLHFALPVMSVESGEATQLGRPLIACDPAGAPLHDLQLPHNGIFVFGTERFGISDELMAAADVTVAIPMRSGVSSLNLATSVAVILYAAFGLG